MTVLMTNDSTDFHTAYKYRTTARRSRDQFHAAQRCIQPMNAFYWMRSFTT